MMMMMMMNHLLIYYLKIAACNSVPSDQAGACDLTSIDRNKAPKPHYHAKFPKGVINYRFALSFVFSQKCALSGGPQVACSLARQLFWR